MDSTALTPLVDRWRRETHTFHLACGETTVTLQDIAMILGLTIDGTPVCGPMSPSGWRDVVGDAIGIRPPDVAVEQMGKKSSGIHSGWLTANFNTCPEGR
jgi:hypothetical protein